MKTIDSFQHPAPTCPVPSKRPLATGTGARFTAFAANTPRRRMAWSTALPVLASPLLFVLAMVTLLGMALVAMYGIIAIVGRWQSRNSFVLALVAFIYMVILQLAAAETIAQGMAVFAYMFLVIGAISLAREVKMRSRLWFKKR